MSRTPPSTRAHYRDFYRLQTRWNDNDAYGHMNNAVHYGLFDTAINGWLIGKGVLDVKGGDQIGLVVETGCRYFAELGYPQDIQAGLRVAHMGTSSVRYEIGLFGEGEDTAAAEGFFVHVYVDAETRRPKPINDNLKAALTALTAA